ncbi:aldehyde dehydrogenase [Verminephrobacter eiseniae]|uniref:4-(hydroxymethyl)benzenesulfonate dehydrogenase n=1 Tax=Verminephrobacter eiseniae (strain EF01-2) TaxID=391735 RepID=A1WJN1_VEREI|nr:aldehyde dehydrogenase [Verminephrobacter eiseniae]ABM57838.1 Betaine-aldehyde dehydrogenase [Verminephrobacter eiseniae EF01-2]MCW5283445.1 aldehyde dehydrogenase [Verminephrobacter eiseniae]MCW5301154.1 aldehyde dehydrogenase [Verminephrobacter eiseniae]MCW8178632.1 aldehyde dehydrogenase [Verminephrobacter eiseniae]MCW8190204.1 aldehyde dehydrogenase [Verminephrobacter eiseniae]
MPEPKPMLIAGADVPCEAGIAPLLSINPATGQTNYEVAAAGPETVDFAVRNAASACADRGWREMLPMQRARILLGIADGIERDGAMLARLQMQENGKVWSECRRQVQSAAATFRYYAGVCEVTGSEVTPARGNYLSMTLHEPYGVVAAITPWNSPMTMEAQKMAPALAAGNAVILKPSEVTPSTGLAVARIALQAGLPEGILNVLPGTGQGAGAALVAHPLVRMVSFTGGTESGRRIGEIAARKLMPVALELGGKSPHILFEDADVDAAVAAVAEGIFEGSGQSCVAGSRLFVHASIHHVVLKKLLERARSLRVDLPDAPGAEMGPLATFAQRDKVQAMVDEARAAGASILAGGTRPDACALANGAYYLPTIIAGIDNRARIAQQEIFGPVLCVLTFGNEEDLIAQANGTAFGLAAGIWTADYQRAWRVARALDAGTVWINTYKQLSVASPFGGFKDSGIGREKGIAGMRLYQQPKSIYFGMA